ncbi:MAG: hypothetical protein ACYC2O_03625, partial [Microthrixaceae bacterium]
AVIPVLVALALLAVSGLLALRATLRIERTTATMEALRPAGWREACIGVEHATDELVRQLSRRTEG